MWVFPNPAEAQAEIRWEGLSDGQILLCDMNGKTLKELAYIQSERQVLPLEGLAKGYYFVKRVHQNGTVLEVKKLIVK